MNYSSMIKGIAAGMVVGAITYAVSNATARDRRRLKSNTFKAVRSVGNVINGITSMMS